jgi:hypothetical protein
VQVFSLLAIAGAIFFTRNSWEPALHHLTSAKTGAGATQATSTAVACPADVASTITDGGSSTLIAAYDTSEFAITLCTGSTGAVYYNGVDRQNPSQWITLPATMANGTYTASNNGYTYQVTHQDLVVSHAGTTLVDQPLSPAS